MREISPTLANGEHQPGLESQGRAASMPRLAAETQVSEGDFTGGGRLSVGQELGIFSLLAMLMKVACCRVVFKRRLLNLETGNQPLCVDSGYSRVDTALSPVLLVPGCSKKQPKEILLSG